MLISELAYLRSVRIRAEGHVEPNKSALMSADELPFAIPAVPSGMVPVGIKTVVRINGDFTGVDESVACLAVNAEEYERALSGEGIAAVTGSIRVLHGVGTFKGKVINSAEGEIPFVFAGDWTAVDPESGMRTGREWVRWDGPGTDGLKGLIGAAMLTDSFANLETNRVHGTVHGHVHVLEDPDAYNYVGRDGDCADPSRG